MKKRIITSAAILPMCGYGRRSDAASPAKGVPKEKQRPNIVSRFWLTTWDGRTLRLPFWTHTNALQTTLTTRRIWNAWRHKGRCSHKHTPVVSAPPPGSVFLQGMNAARHRVTSWTLRKIQTH